MKYLILPLIWDSNQAMKIDCEIAKKIKKINIINIC